jgi:hypothetical protein
MADLTHARKEDELDTRVAHLFKSYSMTRNTAEKRLRMRQHY